MAIYLDLLLLRYCETCGVMDEKLHEERKKVTGCTLGPSHWCHLRQKKKLRSVGKEIYYQLCMDDEGPYTISHSNDPDYDLVQHTVPEEDVAESGRPGRAELLAKKGSIVGGVGCPPNCRTSGKPRGSFPDDSNQPSR